MRLAVFTVLLALPLAAAAQIYRWVDEKGKVHFTQTPPPAGKDFKAVPSAPPPPANPGSVPSLGEYANKLQNEREQREQAQAQSEQAAQRRRQTCSAARSQQAFLNRYDGRVGTMTEDGGRKPWAPERYAQERARAEAAIAANCDG